MNRRWAVLGWLVAAGAVLAGAVLAAGGDDRGDHLPRAAPALSGTDLSGRYHDLSDLRGQVVLVTAWASWCDPCREEVPVLSTALDRYGSDGLRVLGLNVQDRPENARAFVQTHRPAFDSILDAEGTIAVEWGLRGLPETFVVDRDGRVVAHRYGAVTEEWMESVVLPVVLS